METFKEYFEKRINESKQDVYDKIYGGKNTNKEPFDAGDKIKQIYRLDDNKQIVKDGKGEYNFLGMKGDMMQIQPLNKDALHSTDVRNPELVKLAQEKGYNPSMDRIFQLHYKYADRFEKK